MKDEIRLSNHIAEYKCRMCGASFSREINTSDITPELLLFSLSISSMMSSLMTREEIKTLRELAGLDLFISPYIAHECSKIGYGEDAVRFGIADLQGIIDVRAEGEAN